MGRGPAPSCPPRAATLGRGVVVRVGVTLAAVLHQEGGVVPGHAEDAVRLVQEDVGQHPAVAVHDDHLPIGGAKQYLQQRSGTPDGRAARTAVVAPPHLNVFTGENT